jgi:uncharacterized membrane protein YdjX (TVP38/TMEM64 family)
MPQTSKTTVERKKNTHWERFLCARRLLMIAVPLIAAIYAVAFCVFPGTGLPYRAISISVGLFWGAVIIAVISLFANLIIRNRESD